MLPGIGTSAVFEMFGKPSQREAVQHTLFRHPALARHLDTPVGEIDFRCRMRVRIDGHYATEFERASVPPPVEVETPRVGIDLNGYAMLGAGRENLFDVHLVSWPP